MKKTLAVILCLAAWSCAAMDRFEALSMLESGDNDFAVGRSGEVSRYQILPRVWRETLPFVPLAQATNSFWSNQCALLIALHREDRFLKQRGRWPTDFEFYKLWNPKCPDETARRFANLCARKEDNCHPKEGE